MFLETILADAVRVEEAPRTSGSALSGRWRNRLGSTMDLTVSDDHRVHGTFHTNATSPEGGAAFPVGGFVEGDALCFCVDFGSRGSVASWAGHHLTDADGEHLVTLWHLARPVRSPHDDADVWAALLAGGDRFDRID